MSTKKSNELKERMKTIMNPEELARMLIREREDGTTVVCMDLHQLSYKRAERLVRNTINVSRKPFLLRVIHGYHSGTVLREMVREELENKRISEKVTVPWNPGETYLRIA